MGSINPVFILPGALNSSAADIAQGLFGSINLGVGQFCTSPGVIVGRDGDDLQQFRNKLESLFEKGGPGTMLHAGILKGYVENVEQRGKIQGVVAVRSAEKSDQSKTEALPVLFETEAERWLAEKQLATEIFGPSAVLVRSQSKEELLRIANDLPGTLTATLFGTAEDLNEHRELIAVLENKAGRLIFNGFPTGVEVTHAMHHGGPYPATADAKFTSVGTAAILRFLRPVCFQNFPQESLPLELRDDNPPGIWRTVNGEFTKAGISAKT